MEELQRQENSSLTSQAKIDNKLDNQNKLTIILLILVGVAILSGTFYAGMKFSTRERSSVSPVTPPSLTPVPTGILVQPTITTSQDIQSEPTSKPGALIKQINYKKITGWIEYKSDAGYSLQYPSSFYDTGELGESWKSGSCVMFFGNDAGGVLSARVSPYSGGSRRQLFGISPGYDYKFEEAIIQGKNSLIIEAGPIGDSGSGSGVVIPVGKHALILSWSNRGKDSKDFVNLLQSIQVGNSLDLTKCDRTTDEVKFSGSVSNITYGCFNLDGTCEVYVDNKRVIVQIGSEPEKFPQYGVRGQLIGINLSSAAKDKFIDKKVEVYGKMGDVNNYTIYGDKKYYLKLVE